MSEPSVKHLESIKRILRYLNGTRNLGLFFKNETDGFNFRGYSDSDWAGSIDDRKSTTGFIFFLGTKPISWNASKQKCVALSTAESEYVALGEAAKESVWLKRLIQEMKELRGGPVTIFVDNTSAISMAKNPVMHKRTKHVEIQYHYTRELVKEGELALVYCNTKDQIADFLTKPLPAETFAELRTKAGVMSLAEVMIKGEC